MVPWDSPAIDQKLEVLLGVAPPARVPPTAPMKPVSQRSSGWRHNWRARHWGVCLTPPSTGAGWTRPRRAQSPRACSQRLHGIGGIAWRRWGHVLGARPGPDLGRLLPPFTF